MMLIFTGVKIFCMFNNKLLLNNQDSKTSASVATASAAESPAGPEEGAKRKLRRLGNK